jgi:hypothetical protein
MWQYYQVLECAIPPEMQNNLPQSGVSGKAHTTHTKSTTTNIPKNTGLDL